MDILKRKPDNNYQGYILTKYYQLTSQPIVWSDAKRLKRLPHKITAFIKKEIIQEIRKLSFDNFTYYLLTTDNKYYELIY